MSSIKFKNGYEWSKYVLEAAVKECRSILRGEASVYFNVTAVHV